MRGGGIKTHYLEVSRNALYRVALKPLDEQDFTYFFKKIYKISIYQFLNSLSFSEQEIANIEKEIGENIRNKKRNFDKTLTFKKLKNCELFKQVYERKRLEQEGVFDKYLQSFGVDFSKEGLNIVDVGWRGSMQDMLIAYLGPNINVNGWYVGYLKLAFVKNYKDKNLKAKKGLLHHMGKNSQLGNKCFEPIFADYEQICRANRGSVYGYKLFDGEIKVLYENKIDENLLHTKFILPLQNQIENKFADICKYELKNLSIIEPLSIIKHMEIYRNLSRHDIDFYINAINTHYDNFGSVGIPKGSTLIKRLGFKLADFFLRLRFAQYTQKRVLRMFYKKIYKGKIDC